MLELGADLSVIEEAFDWDWEDFDEIRIAWDREDIEAPFSRQALSRSVRQVGRFGDAAWFARLREINPEFHAIPSHPTNALFMFPLHYAARYNEDPAAIGALTGDSPSAWAYDGVDVNSRGPWGRPLAIAARWNANPAVVRELLALGAYVNVDEGAALYAAAQNETPRAAETVRVLLEAGAAVNGVEPSDGGRVRRPVYAAAMTQNLATLDALIAAGADVNVKGSTPDYSLLADVLSRGRFDCGYAPVAARLRSAGARAERSDGEAFAPGPQVADCEGSGSRPGGGSAGPAAGETWTNTLGMEFVGVPAGSFVMGSPEDEEGRYSDEVQREVRISRGFWIGRYEVTQGEWEAVMGANPSFFFDECGVRCPVETVSWEDVQEFIRRLNARETGRGYVYRLPTEAEWEYAARAGTTGARYGELDEIAWYGGNSGLKTHPVGEKRANAWGLYDMLGNVWEWTADWYGEYPSGAVSDPRGPGTGSDRVIRGGGSDPVIRYGARSVRSANRSRHSPAFGHGALGFRLVRTVEGAEGSGGGSVPPDIEVVLGASGDRVTLRGIEGGGYTLFGDRVSSGTVVTGSDGARYRLDQGADGVWTATLVPTGGGSTGRGDDHGNSAGTATEVTLGLVGLGDWDEQRIADVRAEIVKKLAQLRRSIALDGAAASAEDTRFVNDQRQRLFDEIQAEIQKVFGPGRADDPATTDTDEEIYTGMLTRAATARTSDAKWTAHTDYPVNASGVAQDAGVLGEIEDVLEAFADSEAFADALGIGGIFAGLGRGLGVRSGRIDAAGDEDWFRFETAGSVTVAVYTTGATDTYGELDSSRSDDDTGEGTNFRIEAAVAAGAHLVRVSGFGSATGAYTLHVRQLPGGAGGGGGTGAGSGVGGGSAGTATAIEVGSSLAGRIATAGEVDHYRFEVSEAARVAVYTTGSTDTYGRLDSSATDDDGGEDYNFRIEASVGAGVHIVQVSGYGDATGDYVLHVRALGDSGGGGGTGGGSGGTGSGGSGFVPTAADCMTVERRSRSQIWAVNTCSQRVNFWTRCEYSRSGPWTFSGPHDSSGLDIIGAGAERWSGEEILCSRNSAGDRAFHWAACYAEGPNDAHVYWNEDNSYGCCGGFNRSRCEQSGVIPEPAGPFRCLASGSPGRCEQSGGAGSGGGTGAGAGSGGGSAGTATAIEVGSSQAGRIATAGEVDHYRFEVSEAARVAVYTTGSTDTYGRLDSSATDDDGGEDYNFRIEASVAAGVHIVQVSGLGAATGDYVLHVRGLGASGGGGGTGAGAGGGSSAGPGAGETWTSPLGMEFVGVPAGSFVMGSPEDEEGRGDNERQHEVRISKGFWMGKYEVTQGEWVAVMGANPSSFDECGARCPVEMVSWDAVQEFIRRLNERESGSGYAYRLPTEAEWEYAARAGTTGARHGELDSVAWHGFNSRYTRHPVGEKQANAWGLHDMLGNVEEWVADWYGYEYPSGAVTDPQGPDTGSLRVLRGGGWYGGARGVRSAARNYHLPGAYGDFIGLRGHLGTGFRLVRTE